MANAGLKLISVRMRARYWRVTLVSDGRVR